MPYNVAKQGLHSVIWIKMVEYDWREEGVFNESMGGFRCA